MVRGTFKRGRAPLRLALLLIAISCASSLEAAVRGRWINPSRSVIIDIEPCGHVLCGTVIWASEKAKHDARKGTDQLVGTKLLTGVHHASAHLWKGKIFVPDQNMHASAKLKPEGASDLKVSGCVMMICKSQMWTRTHQSHV
jgi:uncharacterized protein (DUF2147 family)